ncbi:MAG: hypothetical protein D6715_07350 [Calditrichaeota bacterium]|nr:MAG: hypothetical protein D6715_07350 [Calditrichota bacterium]
MEKTDASQCSSGEERFKAVSHLVQGRGFHFTQAHLPEALFQKLPQLASRRERFLTLMHRYSTRLFLHDLLAGGPEVDPTRLTHYVGRDHAARLIEQLKVMDLVEQTDTGLRHRFPQWLNPGWLLEWYLATVLSEEFASPALFNVGLKGARCGGDYDVLACWLGRLLYIEAKSAPPKGIHNPQVAAFLERIEELKPDLAIFLNDTHLRVKDKIVLMFEEEIIKLKGLKSLQQMPVLRVQEQIFHLAHSIYICNSKRDIRTNLRIIFQHYLSYWSKTSIVFQSKEESQWRGK